jgi:hypothetical protein
MAIVVSRSIGSARGARQQKFVLLFVLGTAAVPLGDNGTPMPARRIRRAGCGIAGDQFGFRPRCAGT